MAGQGGERSGAERKEVERLRILSIALHCSLARSLALSLAVSLLSMILLWIYVGASEGIRR